MSLHVYADGMCLGNHSPDVDARISYSCVVVCEEGEILTIDIRRLSAKTNNEAEITALATALEIAKDIAAVDTTLYTDSELAVELMNGNRRAKAENLIAVTKMAKLQKTLAGIGDDQIRHVPRKDSVAGIVLERLHKVGII